MEIKSWVSILSDLMKDLVVDAKQLKGKCRKVDEDVKRLLRLIVAPQKCRFEC